MSAIIDENAIARSEIPHLSLRGVPNEVRELRSNLKTGSEQAPQSLKHVLSEAKGTRFLAALGMTRARGLAMTVRGILE